MTAGGNQFSKAQAGQRQKLPAKTWNAMLDTVDYVDGLRESGGALTGKSSRNNTIIQITNVSGQEVSAYGVLALGEPPANYPSLDVTELITRWAATGIVPQLPGSFGKFCIPIEGLSHNEVGPAIVSGFAPAIVYQPGTIAFPYADVESDRTNALVTGPHGTAQILWQEGGQGYHWALVQLGIPETILHVQLTGDLTLSTTATAEVINVASDKSHVHAQTVSVVDIIGVMNGSMLAVDRSGQLVIPSGTYAIVKRFADSTLFEVLGYGGPRPATTNPEFTVITDVGYDTATGAWRKKTRTIKALNSIASDESDWTNYIVGSDAGSDIQRDDTTTTMSISGGSNYGELATITAHVAPPSGTGYGTPTGSIVLIMTSGTESRPVPIHTGGGYYGDLYLDGSGDISATAFLPAGSWTITAQYGGDASYNGSTSSGASHTVAKAATSVAVTFSNSAPVYGESITLTAKVISGVDSSANELPDPTGYLSFYISGAHGEFTIGTVLLTSDSGDYRTAQCSISYAHFQGLCAGSKSVRVEYAGNSQSGDRNYATSSTTETITVSKAIVSGTVANTSRLYGNANPGFVMPLTGFVFGQSASYISGTPTFTTAAVQTSNVGSYAVTPGVGTMVSENYSFNLQPGTITINTVPLTVHADDASMVYGDAVPNFTGTLSGLKNSDASTITFHAHCEATSTSAPTQYGIIADVGDSGSVLGNYTVSKTNGVLTITKAPLTLTADDKTMVQNATKPTLTATATGIKNSDQLTAYGWCTADGHTIGSFVIVPYVAYSDKSWYYEVTKINATLLVNAAPPIP